MRTDVPPWGESTPRVALIPAMRRRNTTSQAALADLARDQHGVASAGQLRELGIFGQAIARACECAGCTELHRGVYAVGPGVLSPHGRCAPPSWPAGPGRCSVTPPQHGSGDSRAASGRNLDVIASRQPPSTGEDRRSTDPRAPRACRSHHDRPNPVRHPYPATLVDFAAIAGGHALQNAIERAARLDLLKLTRSTQTLALLHGMKGTRRLDERLRSIETRRSAGHDRSGCFSIWSSGPGCHAPDECVHRGPRDRRLLARRSGLRWKSTAGISHRSRRAFEQDPLRLEDLKLSGIEIDQDHRPPIEREPRKLARQLSQLLAAPNRLDLRR